MTRNAIKSSLLTVTGLALLNAGPVFATNVTIPVGEVSWIEATYMPQNIPFKMTTGDVNCPAGTFLTWSNGDVDNMQAVFSTILTARTHSFSHGLYAVYDTATVHNGPFQNRGCRISFIGLDVPRPMIN